VVLRNGSIAGTGTLLGKNIRRVFVLPCHQGKGIGGRIMTELELKAKYDHVDIIDLDSSMVSVEFYHRLGYTGNDHAFIELRSGGMLDYIPMTKKVCLP
jgi:GNAT superfamily N-acetyltransferase